MEEKEREALMLTIVLLRRYYDGKATTAQRVFVPEGVPDCALWTAQSFALHSRYSHSTSNLLGLTLPCFWTTLDIAFFYFFLFFFNFQRKAFPDGSFVALLQPRSQTTFPPPPVIMEEIDRLSMNILDNVFTPIRATAAAQGLNVPMLLCNFLILFAITVKLI